MKSYDGMPLPNEDLLVQITNISNVEEYTESFGQYRALIKSQLEKVASDLDSANNILDFGCGAGRLFYALSPLREGQQMFGCDVNHRAVSWCRENVGYASVTHNGVRDRLSYSDSMFDLAVAVSVFTHLDLELQRLWASELRRVIRPGGFLAMTVHGTSWFPVLLEQRLTHPNAADLHLHHLGSDAMFMDLRFSGAIDDDPQGQREVATAHTDAAVRALFEGFDVACHEERSALANHDTYLLRKGA
jgi:SAM-dependent methyltransferase